MKQVSNEKPIRTSAKTPTQLPARDVETQRSNTSNQVTGSTPVAKDQFAETPVAPPKSGASQAANPRPALALKNPAIRTEDANIQSGIRLPELPTDVLGLVTGGLDAPSLAKLSVSRKEWEGPMRGALLNAWRLQFSERGWTLNVGEGVDLKEVVSRFGALSRAANAEVAACIREGRQNPNDAVPVAVEKASVEKIRACVAPRAQSVTRLDFSGYSGYRSSKFEDLWSMCPNVKEVILPMMTFMHSAKATVESLSRLSKLKALAFHFEIADSSLTEIAHKLPGLTSVRFSVGSSRRCDSVLVSEALRAWPQLKRLVVAPANLLELPAELQNHPALQDVTLPFNESMGLEPLASSQLQIVRFSSSGRPRPIDVSSLSSLIHIPRLDLRGLPGVDMTSLTGPLRDKVARGELLLPRYRFDKR